MIVEKFPKNEHVSNTIQRKLCHDSKDPEQNTKGTEKQFVTLIT
jgi:hypothetical protein